MTDFRSLKTLMTNTLADAQNARVTLAQRALSQYQRLAPHDLRAVADLTMNLTLNQLTTTVGAPGDCLIHGIIRGVDANGAPCLIPKVKAELKAAPGSPALATGLISGQSDARGYFSLLVAEANLPKPNSGEVKTPPPPPVTYSVSFSVGNQVIHSTAATIALVSGTKYVVNVVLNAEDTKKTLGA